jgi:hypothetical protein
VLTGSTNRPRLSVRPSGCSISIGLASGAMHAQIGQVGFRKPHPNRLHAAMHPSDRKPPRCFADWLAVAPDATRSPRACWPTQSGARRCHRTHDLIGLWHVIRRFSYAMTRAKPSRGGMQGHRYFSPAG